MTTQIDLYTAGTPNGHKVNILLCELGVDFTAHAVDISKNVQKEAWYLAICPNGRIPAIVDRTGGGGGGGNGAGAGKRVFEGASILLYLTSKYDKEHKFTFPYDSDEYWEVVEWMVWMQSGIGPMQGQANHFHRYAPTKIDYAVKRYQTETKRLYQVLEDRLAEQEGKGQGLWIVGGKYTIADICCFSWVNWAEWAGVDTEPFPRIEKWMQAINARPAVQKGVNIPERFTMKEKLKSKEGEEEFAKFHSQWVMQGQNADQEKHQ